MAKKVYKPFRKRDWAKIERTRPLVNEKGRVIESVRIGICYDRDGGGEEDIFEDIYADLLPDILAAHSRYKIAANISCKPGLVIFDGSDIIPHNPMIRDYIARIREALSGIDEDLYYRAYRTSWEMTAMKKPMDYSVRAVVQEVNEKTSQNFPAELVIGILRQMEAEAAFSEEADGIKEGIASLSDAELKIAAGDSVAALMHDGVFRSDALTGILRGTAYENEAVVDAVIQEVFRRYIQS